MPNTSIPDNPFSAADAGLQPTATPTPEGDPAVQNTLKTVGIGNPESTPPVQQTAQPTDGHAASATGNQPGTEEIDPRDKHFRAQGGTPLFNDIKARPMDEQQPAAPSGQEPRIIA